MYMDSSMYVFVVNQMQNARDVFKYRLRFVTPRYIGRKKYSLNVSYSMHFCTCVLHTVDDTIDSRASPLAKVTC